MEECFTNDYDSNLDEGSDKEGNLKGKKKKRSVEKTRVKANQYF